LKFLLALFFSLIVVPVFAEPLSDRTGMSTSFDLRVDDKTFVLRSTANFDIQSAGFDDGRLVLQIISSLENNIGELQIPQNITRGQLKFYLDGSEIPAKVLQNEKISFVTLEFEGNGTHTLEMTSDYAPTAFSGQPQAEETPKNPDQVMTVIAVVGTMAVAGIGSTAAFYFKRKAKAV
jgi:hypothetical protein